MTTPTNPSFGSTTEDPAARAAGLRKEKRYEEAVLLYAAVWPSTNKWTGWGYAYCLRKLGRPAEALPIAQSVFDANPSFQQGVSEYARCLFAVIRPATSANQSFIQMSRIIVRISKQEEDRYAPYHPYVRAILLAAKLLVAADKAESSIRWLNHLDVERLDVSERHVSDANGKIRRLASTLEQYYAIKTKALEDLGRWSECIETANLAISKCGRLHHDNEVWFARRIALAKLELGEVTEAIRELEVLVARKPSSFMFADLARAAVLNNDVESTFRYALQALMVNTEPQFKVKALELIADSLSAKGRIEDAKKHLELSIAIRRGLGWRTGKRLLDQAALYGADPLADDAVGRLRDLSREWKKWADELNPRAQGKVERILQNGKAGFLLLPNRDRIYFRLNEWRDRKKKPEPGVPVTFLTSPSFDHKKNCQSQEAKDIRVAS